MIAIHRLPTAADRAAAARKRRVLRLLAKGRTRKQVARKIGITARSLYRLLRQWRDGWC